MEHSKSPWHAKFAFILALLIPVYFAAAALGTKFGFWSWQVGLGSLIITAGPILLGIAALVSLVSLILVVRKAPRKGWLWALIGLIVPVGVFAMIASVGGTAAANPIHDVATDAANPPMFSEATMTARGEFGANPVSDYGTPLGEIEWWSERASDELKAKSHSQLVSELYPDLQSLPLGDIDKEAATAMVTGAMEEIGLTEVNASGDADQALIEGVAETFWFGFKDDVVVRIADGEIDIRSISRVGVSDLGANAARIKQLRDAIASRLEGASAKP